MKAISLWQLWASLMALNAKSIETRHWPTNYRGELAIHAAQRKVKRELVEYLNNPIFRFALFPQLKDDGIWFPDRLIEEIPFGAVVCVVEVYDCKPTDQITNDPPEWFDKGHEIFFGNYEPRRFGWLTRNVRKLANPVFTPGRQGFWNLPPDAESLVRAQLP